MRIFIFAAMVSAVAGAAVAEPMSSKAAKKLMFSTKGAEVALIPNAAVSETDGKILAQVGASQAYYGAIALSPSEGINSPALVAATNHHNVAAASAQALAFCNDKREKGSKPCVIVAEIRPKGWSAKALQLSAGATDALRKDYRKGRGDKAMAVADSTGDFGIGVGEGAAAAAVASCAQKNGASDCQVVIAD